MKFIKFSSLLSPRSLGAIIILLGSSLSLRADAIQDATTAFRAGDYPTAVRAFQTAIASSAPSAGLYYNLAMAQMKDGQNPQATLSLHRAIRLDPQMIDARVALSDLERTQSVPPTPEDWQTLLEEKASLPALYVVGAVLAWIGAFLLLYAIFKHGRKVFPAIAAVVLLLFGTALFFATAFADPRITERSVAIVLSEDGVNLLDAPVDQSATVASLPPGASVRILQRSGAWTYGETRKGEKGWMPSESVETIVPAA